MRYTREEVSTLYHMPFMDLLFKAQAVHRENHNPNKIQSSTLLSIKTGACPEDCKYCSQSAYYNTGLEKEKLLDHSKIVENAKAAKENGSTRFCMGAAWRKVQDKDMPELTEMIKTVKDLGMETCMTLGTLSKEQAYSLKIAGLDYYNHNIDTSREYYKEVISTRSYDERLETLKNVAEAGLQVCCGGIMGMGETEKDRLDFLLELANMEKQPDSVPINQLIAIKGTPLFDKNIEEVHPLDFVRTIATARILMPKSYVRLSAGRESMSEELQALCFFAGANSIFSGEKLLTTGNRAVRSDKELLEKLGMSLETLNETVCEHS